MKKKILNWIYSIYKKILAHEANQYTTSYSTDRIKIIRASVRLEDLRILRSQFNVKEQALSDLRKHILKTAETYVIRETERSEDGLGTIYTDSLKLIIPIENGTNKNE